MKKATKFLLGIFTFSILISGMALAQNVSNMYYSGEFNSFGAEAMTFVSGPNHWKVTLQASGDDSESNFLFRDSNSNFNNKWSRGDAISFGTENTAFWQGNDTRFNATNTKYYTFILSNVSISSNGTLTVQETTSNPISISSVSTDSVRSDSLYFSITLNSAKSAEEKIYIRYTNDNFSTSKHVLATGSGTAYTVSVPFTDDIIYYFLTTTVDLGSDNTTYSGNYDLVTLSLENNSGSNYSLDYGFSREISGTAGWRLLSLPKTGGTVADVSDDSPVQGITGGSDASADANFYIYNNTGAFSEPTNTSTAWGDGLGFAMYFYNNTTNGSSTLPVTLDASGTEPTSDVVVDLYSGATGRWTLVGNPFASRVDLSQVSANIAISSNVAFWDNAAGSYTTASTSSTLIIEPWQGYWVATGASTSGGQLTFGVNDKTNSAATQTHFDKTVAEIESDLEFTLESSYNTEKNFKIQFRDDAVLGWDTWDLTKLTPLIPNYITAGFEGDLEGESVFKAIESLPLELQEEVTIPINYELVGESQNVRMSWSGMGSIPDELEFILHDYELDQSINMRDNSEYSFDAISSEKQKANPLSSLNGVPSQILKLKGTTNRFGITIRPTSVSNETEESPALFALEQNYPNPFNPSTTISYSVQEAGAVNISVYNLMGQKVATLVDETKAAGQYNVRWNAAGAASGMYYYRLEAGGQSITRKMTLIK